MCSRALAPPLTPTLRDYNSEKLHFAEVIIIGTTVFTRKHGLKEHILIRNAAYSNAHLHGLSRHELPE